MNFTKFSLKEPLFIIVFWAIIIIIGSQSLMRLPVKFLPEAKKVSISIVTVYPGADKMRVLDNVTKKLEDELNPLKSIDNIVSTTQNEISQITVTFKLGTSPEKGSFSVLLAVNKAKASFPNEVKDPVISLWDLAQVPLVTIAMTSALPEPEFYDYLERSIKPKFEAIEGVSRTALVGQRQKQVTVNLDLEKMKEREVSASEVISRLKQLGENTYIGKESSYFFLGGFSSLNDLGAVPVHFVSNDRVVSLKEISTINEELSEPSVYSYINGSPCVVLEIYAHPDADSLIIEDALPGLISQIEQQSKDKEKIQTFSLTNSGVNLTHNLTDFKRNSLFAIFVAIFLIWAVFKDFRSIFISCTSIPASLCGAFIVMEFLDYSLNVYTIPAIIVSIGLIIDDMIVIRENIFRHLEKGLNPFEATRVGMKEISGPVIGTTFMIFSVALPLIVLSSTETTLYLKNFGVTLLCTMVFSLLEALTLGPVLCAYFLPMKTKHRKEPIQEAIDRCYDRSLYYIKRYPKAILLGGLGITILGLFVASKLETENTPASSIADIEVRLTVDRGLPLKIVNDQAKEFSDTIFKQNASNIAQLGIRVENNNEIYFYVKMVEENKRSITTKQFKSILQNNIQELLDQHRISSYYVKADVIAHPGYSYGFALRFNSFNLPLLKEYTSKLYASLSHLKGVINLQNTSEVKEQETAIALDFEKMKHLGVVTNPAVKEINLLLNGDEPVTYHPLHKTHALKSEIKVKTNLPLANPQELLLRSNVPNLNSMLIPLDKITAEPMREYSIPIKRMNGEDFIEISADVDRYGPHDNPSAIAANLMATDLPVPEGITASWQQVSKAVREMGGIEKKLAIFAVSFLFISLIIMYESVTLPLIILLPIPVSLAGAFFGLFITGSSINTYSIIGIILVAGIAAKNGVILVDYTLQLIDQGMDATEAVYHASSIRLRPILMTTFGVLLTTIPIIIPWDDFAKLQVSLGYAIIGGLITGTILSLFVMPVLFKYTYSFHLWVHRWSLKHINLPEQFDEKM